MTDYRAFLRRKLLEDMYDKMSDEEKRTFVLMTMQDSSADEIREALRNQSRQLTGIKKGQQTFTEDFVSNLLANATWDSVTWLLSKLLRR